MDAGDYDTHRRGSGALHRCPGRTVIAYCPTLATGFEYSLSMLVRCDGGSTMRCDLSRRMQTRSCAFAPAFSASVTRACCSGVIPAIPALATMYETARTPLRMYRLFSFGTP